MATAMMMMMEERNAKAEWVVFRDLLTFGDVRVV